MNLTKTVSFVAKFDFLLFVENPDVFEMECGDPDESCTYVRMSDEYMYQSFK